MTIPKKPRKRKPVELEIFEREFIKNYRNKTIKQRNKYDRRISKKELEDLLDET